MSATVFSRANFVFHGHISYKAELNSFQVLIGLNGHVTLAKTASLVSQETEISNIVKPRPKSQTPKAQPQPSQIQSKSVPKGLGLTLKS